MSDATDSIMAADQGAELYSELMGRSMHLSRFNRLLRAGRFGKLGVDYGRFGSKPQSRWWVRESAVRRLVAEVKAARDAEVARLGETWSRRAELAALKALEYRQMQAGEQ